jgi:hypothetical protein
MLALIVCTPGKAVNQLHEKRKRMLATEAETHMLPIRNMLCCLPIGLTLC